MPTESLIAGGLDCAPPLTPKLAPWMRGFIEQPPLARDLIEAYGSPLHVVVASEFRRNVKDLLAPLAARGVSGGLFFARKANKLPWFVSLAKEEGIGVDTASLNELEETIALGVPGERVVVTAVGKNRQLVSTAVEAGCLLVVDNADELNLVQSVAESIGLPAHIGLRFSGFEVDGLKVFSRFGFPHEDSSELIARVAASFFLKLELLHAHLDRYDVHERAAAARRLIEISDQARAMGLSIAKIDLGGGILMRYLESADEWEAFVEALKSSVLGERPALTHRGDGLGYVKAGGKLIGQADLYPAWNAVSKERFLAAILDHAGAGAPLYRELADRGLKLYFEPGRALLDNTGITLASVAFRKRDTLGNLIIGLAMNRFNLRPFRAEFCSDPIFMPSSARQPASEGAFLVGCLCSESDLIFRRKLRLALMPEPGDLFCFANTSGYLAHHLEIGTHGDPLANNLLIDPGNLSVIDQFPPKAH